MAAAASLARLLFYSVQVRENAAPIPWKNRSFLAKIMSSKIMFSKKYVYSKAGNEIFFVPSKIGVMGLHQ